MTSSTLRILIGCILMEIVVCYITGSGWAEDKGNEGVHLI